MPVTPQNVGDVFSYHAPEGDQLDRYAAIRRAAHDFADQQAALRHVREAMMTANAAIALKGAV